MPDTTELAHDLRLAVARLARRLRQEQSVTGLSLTQTSALAVVVHWGPLTSGDLAAREQVRPPSITRVVDSLVEAGLVCRRDNPADGRQVLVEATELGRSKVLEVNRAREEWLRERLAELTTSEQDVLRDAALLLARLTGRPV